MNQWTQGPRLQSQSPRSFRSLSDFTLPMKRSFIIAIAIVFILPSSFRWFWNDIPKTWDIEAIERSHLPPPDTSVKVIYAPEAYYNSLPEHVIYKTYPVFVRELEKPGYLDSLRQLEPEVVFDPAKLKTQEDWIKAGELVFNWPASYRLDTGKQSSLDRKYIEATGAKMTLDGKYPFTQYVITEKGKVLWGNLSCASCHTRVMPSGEVIPGAQGNAAGDPGFAYTIQTRKIPLPRLQELERQLSQAPWTPEGLQLIPASVEEFVAKLRAVPDGAVTRQGDSYLYPLTIPSLIGLKDSKYLDHTGLMRHDGPGDLMRYAAFNQGMDMLTSYNGFIPGGKNRQSELPSASEWKHPFGYAAKRYSDAQLYALTQYIYSLQPPKNPNHFPKATLIRGEKVFTQAGCVTCHTPPLYTNNKLTPASGFEPPRDHFKKYDIFNVSVETDSVTTLYTRRGTGYYKVPSLRGVWFRSAFFHNGNLTRLEEVLDPRRLQADYVPSGFKPPHRKTMAVKGHPFGLELGEADKKALVSFLKTL